MTDTPNRPPLSPAAQAVLDAVTEICPAPADEIAAAALRTAADHMASHHSKKMLYSIADSLKLHAIAAELDGAEQ